MKVIAIIQARISSSRLPAKVMLDLCGKTLLERVVDRVRLSTILDEVWIATSNEREDNLIEELAKKIDVNCFRGSLSNVLDRYYQASKLAEADIIVRITADNPLTDPSLIDISVKEIISNNYDYVGFSNIPLGTGVEAFTFKSLEALTNREELTDYHYEHVTSFYYENPSYYNVKIKNDFYPEKISDIRVTVDTLDDYIYVAKIYSEMIDKTLNPQEYLKYLLSRKVFGY